MPIVLLMNVILLGVGIAILLTQRSIIYMIIGLEIILQAAISNCITFNSYHQDIALEGQVLAIFATVIASCEIVILIALCLCIHQQYKIIDINKLDLPVAEKDRYQ